MRKDERQEVCGLSCTVVALLVIVLIVIVVVIVVIVVIVLYVHTVTPFA